MVTLVLSRGEQLARAIPPRYAGFSIGLENPNDIVADFKHAIEEAG